MSNLSYISQKHWKYPTCHIRDIATYIQRGVTPTYTKNKDNGMIIINQKCIRNNRLSFKHAQFHNIILKPIPQDKILRKGDIAINAMSISTNTIGRSTVINTDNILCDGLVIILRIDHIKYNYKYLQYVLQSIKPIINNIAEGTAQKQLPPKRLYSLSIPNPPLNIQNKISHIISTLDKKIDINKDMANKTIKLVEYLYKQVAITVKNKVDIITGLGKPVCGNTPSTKNPEYWNVESGIPFIDIVCLKYVLGNLLIKSNSYLNHIDQFKVVNIGNVLLSNRGTVGKIIISGVQCIAGQGFYVFNSSCNLTTGLIYASLRYVEKLITNRTYSQTTMRAINLNLLQSILIPDPQDEKLQSIAPKLDKLIKLIREVNIETEQLIKIREYIMPYMVFGII